MFLVSWNQNVYDCFCTPPPLQVVPILSQINLVCSLTCYSCWNGFNMIPHTDLIIKLNNLKARKFRMSFRTGRNKLSLRYTIWYVWRTHNVPWKILVCDIGSDWERENYTRMSVIWTLLRSRIKINVRRHINTRGRREIGTLFFVVKLVQKSQSGDISLNMGIILIYILAT